MVLETPLLKVSRPVAACSRCRAAKIKCDGKLPACSACEKTGKSAECASANDNFARGKERSYVSTLETRIEKLERRLQEARRRKSSTLSPNDSATTANFPAADVQRSDQRVVSASGRAAKRKEARDIDEIVSDFGYLTVNATARDYRGFNSFMSYAKLILSASTKAKLPPSAFARLPARQQVRSTIQQYIDHTLSLYPFLDDTSLYYSIDAVYNSLQDPNSPASAFDHWSVRLALAITNAYKTEQSGDQYSLLATGHVSAAMEHAESVLLPGSIMSVQALLFLAQYALIDPHHFDSWSLVGAASRAMVDLGLHADVPKDTKITRAKLELRRKVFYCVYMFDRAAAIVNSRSYSFSDASFSVTNPFQPAPRTQSSSGGSSWMNPFERAHELLSVRLIQSKWYYDLFQSGRDPWTAPYLYIWKTYRELTSWFNGLSHGTSQALRILFELELCYSYVYILGPSCRNLRPHPYAQALLFHHCSTYAALLLRAVADRAQGVPIGYNDNMKAYMTGMQLLDVLVKSRDQIISGVAPEPPQNHDSSIQAPPLPQLNTDANTNLLTAITAIQNIKEALLQLGHRFGSMSWHESFQTAVEPMLSALNSRLWELSQTNVSQRPGMYQHVSSRSVTTMRHVGQMSASPAQHGIYAGTPPQSTEQHVRGMYVAHHDSYAPQQQQQQQQQHLLPTYPSPAVTPPVGPQYGQTAYDQGAGQQYISPWNGANAGTVQAPDHSIQHQQSQFGR